MVSSHCVNSSNLKTSTAANTGLLPKARPERSFVPGPLTPQEIESLRQDRIASAKHSREYFQKHVPHLMHKSGQRGE